VRKPLLTLLVLGAVALLGWRIFQRFQEEAGPAPESGGPEATPVEVAPVEHRAITLRRTFSGTLDADAEFLVAPKVGGRLVRLEVDLGDPVQRGQVVARLDDEEFVLAVRQAEAELEVAKANLDEAISALEIVGRTLGRIESLHQDGVASETEYDAAKAEELEKSTRRDVARAQVSRAEAALDAAKLRLAYTEVPASWTGGDAERVVASRRVDEGDMVAANTPLFSIVELDPIRAVIFVAERDYGRLSPDQVAWLTTDAYPEDRFEARVRRIAPVFRESTRQARVELRVENPRQSLKPGMFVRVTIEFESVADATVVPFAALAEREGTTGVFVVDADGRSVRWVEARPGIREDAFVEVEGDGIAGRVVTLGHQFCRDGGAITIPGVADGAQPPAPLP
jgi:RND family efflux transporter MFP subunit